VQILSFTNRFIRRNRNNIDREHHIPLHFAKLGYHAVLNERCVFLEKQHSCILFSDLYTVVQYAHTRWSDIILNSIDIIELDDIVIEFQLPIRGIECGYPASLYYIVERVVISETE